jgi:hypothetical protein
MDQHSRDDSQYELRLSLGACPHCYKDRNQTVRFTEKWLVRTAKGTARKKEKLVACFCRVCNLNAFDL